MCVCLIPLMNSCSVGEPMLLRWALSSLQSFSESSQVCLWVKYLWDRPRIPVFSPVFRTGCLIVSETSVVCLSIHSCDVQSFHI